MGDGAQLPSGMYDVCLCSSHLYATCLCSRQSHDRVLSHLDEYIEAQTVDVVEITQSEQAGEQAAGQHAHGEVQANGQALSNDAAAPTHSDDITLNQHRACWEQLREGTSFFLCVTTQQLTKLANVTAHLTTSSIFRTFYRLVDVLIIGENIWQIHLLFRSAQIDPPPHFT